MFKVKYLFVALFSLVFLCGCGKTPDADLNNGTSGSSAVVYATNISINETNLTYFVDDIINLNNLNVVITPNNATVKPTFSVNNTNVAEIIDSTLTFKAEGTVVLTASVLIDVNTYKTFSLTFNVETKPVYAQSISVASNAVALNFDETKINGLTINPSTYNQDLSVTYSNNFVATYNPETGLITPISAGETVVTVKAFKSKTEVVETTFTVIVTNKIYATEISEIKLNNVAANNNIVLAVNETGNLVSSVLPNNYNLGVVYECSNNLISINSEGTFVVGNNTGDCVITATAVGANGAITKQINVSVISIPNRINFSIKHNNEVVDCLYVGETYELTVLTTLADYSLLNFENCNYTQVNNNVFSISVASAGSVNIRVNYTISSFMNNYNIAGSSTYNVYNKITDINFSLLNNSVEIVPNQGIYTLYLPNTDMLAEAITDNALVFADINLEAKGINTKPSSLNYVLVGDAVTLSGNRLTANKLGSATLKISSNDIGGFTKDVALQVQPLSASEIIVDKTINLYINGNSSQPSSIELEYMVVPAYAHNTEVVIENTDSSINIEGNIITAMEEGSATVTLTCGDVVESIVVNSYYVITDFSVFIDSEKLENNSEIDIIIGTDFYLKTYIFSGAVELNKPVQLYENNELVTTFNGTLKCNLSQEKSHNFKIVCEDFVLNFVVNIIATNPVVSFEFVNGNLELNMFEATEHILNYVLELENSSRPTTDSFVIVSSEPGIVEVVDNKLVLIQVGEVIISAKVNGVTVDSFNLKVINKEINYINTLSDFININPTKNYVVMSDLDFSTFTANNSVDLSGEINFNNKTITNLKTRLFNTINSGAKVENLIVSGSVSLDVNNVLVNDSLIPNFTFICDENNGVINNITFKDLTLNFTNDSSVSNAQMSLISTVNKGVISDINLNSVNVLFNYKSIIFAGVVVGGLTNVNHGEINGVTGVATFTGFTRIGGITIDNHANISNVELTLNLNCAQTKHQVGGVIHKNKLSTENSNLPELTNIDLTINAINTNSGTINFAGFVYNVLDNYIANNINLAINFEGEFSSGTTYLVHYTPSGAQPDMDKFNIVTSGMGSESFNNYQA